MTPVHDLLPIAQQAMKTALHILNTMPAGRLTPKGDRDVATDVDYAIEDQVRRLLGRETPEIGFFGEERGGESDAHEVWMLDPIDGTSNFTHDLPIFGVSLALLRFGNPVLGLVSLPRLDLHYHAEYGRGAVCNSKPISVAPTSSIGRSIVSIGDYATGMGAERKNADRIAITARLAARVERIRMVGSAATDLVWVAHGKLDAAIILSNNPWDTAAGTLIAREAGAVTVDRYGVDHSMRSASTIVVAPHIAKQLLSLLSTSATS